jgi:hypothetical protein
VDVDGGADERERLACELGFEGNVEEVGLEVGAEGGVPEGR